MSGLFSLIPFARRGPVVAVLPLSGVIGRVGPVRRGLTLSSLEAAIERAFTRRKLAAVALSVNSPGGSPVQSALIANRIRALADEKDIPVYAFAEDVAASGGYWLALAADEIYADANSVIGSIGVVSGSFGLERLIKRFGIQRRLHTAGDKKAMLDPFLPEKPADVRHLKALQGEIHESFKAWVKARRGKRLKATARQAFSGAFWTGAKAHEMGLIDGIGDMRSVMRGKFGPDVRFRSMAPRQPFWRRRAGFAAFGPDAVPDRGPDWAAGLIAAIEERLIWSRFGL